MRTIDNVLCKANQYYDSMKMTKDIVVEEKKKNDA